MRKVGNGGKKMILMVVYYRSFPHSLRSTSKEMLSKSASKDTPFSHLIARVDWSDSLQWIFIIPNQLASKSPYIKQSTMVFSMTQMGLVIKYGK